MGRDGVCAIIEECARNVPPKQTALLGYLKELSTESDGERANAQNIGARLWLSLLRPEAVSSLAEVTWSFKLDESVLGVLQRLIGHGILGAGDTVDITAPTSAEKSDEAVSTVLKTFDIINETMKTIEAKFNVHNATSSAQLKLIQLLLTASTSPHRALGGIHLKMALKKLSQILLYSKQGVNQNAARAAIIQIVHERMEGTLGESRSALDQGWVCEVIQDGRCPASLVLLNLELLAAVLKNYSGLFRKGGDLETTIGEQVLPVLIGPLDLVDEGIYERCLQVLQVLIEEHMEDYSEAIEVLVKDYLGTPTLPSEEAAKTTPRIKPHLRPLRNKLRSLEFLEKNVWKRPQTLFDWFTNYDSIMGAEPLVEMTLELLNVFLEVDWHRAEGSRLAGSAFTDKDLTLKLACIEGLQAFSSSVMEWHKKGSCSNLATDISKDENDQSTSHKLQKSNSKNFTAIEAFQRVFERRRALSDCVRVFNARPIQGLELAIQLGFIEEASLESQARWLRFTRGLSKQAIGECLGGVERASLLYAYTNTFDFSSRVGDGGISFVGALRQYLESFRIPGEAQVIERLMEEFSRRLHETAPTLGDREVLFQLAYSALMLNTDMYSANVRDKMGRGAFVKNTLGAIQESKRPSVIILESIYDEIATGEIRLYSQTVEHPLPLGSRGIGSFSTCTVGEGVVPLILSVADLWARTVSLALDKFHLWPPSSGSNRFESHEDFIGSMLTCVSDMIEVTCDLCMDRERYCILERLLSTVDFQPDYSGGIETTDALDWLYDICDERGMTLGTSWIVILACLSQWDRASIVDNQHNLRELDLMKLDGAGLLSFSSALFGLRRTNASTKSFVSHYMERLRQLPPSHLERLIRHSYDPSSSQVTITNDPIFALLARSADDSLLAPGAFTLLQRVAREQMPLLMELPDEAMFGYLRALERFGLHPDASVGHDAIEALLLIGELLFAHHRTGNEPPLVGDEEFFLKWYHVLSGLSRIAAEQPGAEVARVATQHLFSMLRTQGSCYQVGAWRVVWRSIIFPLIEEAHGRDDEGGKGNSEALDTTVGPVAKNETFVRLMEWAIQLMTLHGNLLFSTALVEIFDNILRYVEEIAGTVQSVLLTESGIRFLLLLVLPNHGKHFRTHHWTRIVATIERIFLTYSPKELNDFTSSVEHLHSADDAPGLEHLDYTNISASTVAFPERRPSITTIRSPLEILSVSTGFGLSGLQLLARQCTLQLHFLDMLRDLTTRASPETSIINPASNIPFSNLTCLLDMLVSSYEMAFAFNENLPLRTAMVRAGYAESLELLVLNRQETGTLHLLVEILFKFYWEALQGSSQLSSLKNDNEALKQVINRYFNTTVVALQRYVSLKQPSSIRRRIGKTWTDLVTTVLYQWKRISDALWTAGSSDPAKNPKERGSTVEPHFKLLYMGGKTFESQLKLALEVALAADRNSTICIAAKDFLLSSTAQLIQANQARLN